VNALALKFSGGAVELPLLQKVVAAFGSSLTRSVTVSLCAVEKSRLNVETFGPCASTVELICHW
jgi:hypothetical protein